MKHYKRKIWLHLAFISWDMYITVQYSKIHYTDTGQYWVSEYCILFPHHCSLGDAKELLKSFSSLDALHEALRLTLPKLGAIQMERVVGRIFVADFSDRVLFTVVLLL